MAQITTDFTAGGRHLSRGHGSPDLSSALRDIADDLAGLKVATVTSPNATDLATALTLLNEVKTKLNAIAAYVLKTTKGA